MMAGLKKANPQVNGETSKPDSALVDSSGELLQSQGQLSYSFCCGTQGKCPSQAFSSLD